ncbi:hypothetical protein [Ornithinimicrobium avium]|uniref:hypothetical protein n=1 Tax=Ornithinimicrobium avium TaxID=2283195 RepID=UPI0013B36262|nr:hypothetical protein [Ornithinimicrobium avium]
MRTARITAGALAVGGLARWAAPLLRRRTPEHLVLAGAVFADGLHRVVRRWR